MGTGPSGRLIPDFTSIPFLNFTPAITSPNILQGNHRMPSVHCRVSKDNVLL
jgi:hypothetical protein